MKIKVFILALAFVLLATLSFAGAKAEKQPGTTETVGPVYGGKITWLANWIQIEAETVGIKFDMAKHAATRCYHDAYIENMATADIEKYGPRGTGEWPFKTTNIVPDQYVGGGLAESWELSPDKQIFHLRKGVMWTGNERIGMAPREFTAHDAEFSIKRWLNHPEAFVKQSWYDTDNIKALDDYTLLVPLKWFNADALRWHTVFFGVQPEEVVKAGASDWRNQTGTGPFILTNYVEDAYLAYDRNPNYWAKTKIDGKEYEIPFIDELIFPIIMDESTQIAAIRTAELDYIARVFMKYKDTLQKSSPDLIMDPYLFDNSIKLYMDTATPPFDKLEVRRAIWQATDLKTICKAVYTEGEVYNYPTTSAGVAYTPPEERPASANELYDYNPDKAKKMLAEAGYSDGFDVKISLPAGEIEFEDIGAMIVDMWGKVGVDVNLNVVETAALHAAVGDYNYGDAYLSGWGGDPSEFGHASRVTDNGSANPTRMKDPYIDETWPKVASMVDPVERVKLAKELNMYVLETASVMGICSAYGYHVWWPWLKNYYGELDAAHLNPVPMIARMWVDEAMKKNLGF